MLYYISTAKLPSKEANAIQQVRMCQSFRRSDVDVQLIHPSFGDLRKRVSWESISDYYRLNSKFTIQTVPDLQSRFSGLPQIGVISMGSLMTAWLTSRVVAGELDRSDIVYGRNYYGMFLFNELRNILPVKWRPKVAFEVHEPISAHMKPRFFKEIDCIVCITHKLKRYMMLEYGIAESKIHVAPDGVDLEPYEDISKEEAREKLKIHPKKRIIMYTGHLYRGKGVEVLVRAARDIDATVYIVGGYKTDIERVKQETNPPENVIFTGFVNPSEIPMYQIAADVLVAPYTEDSRPWVSPLKLFEYMAAEKPILASDREVLQEVLTDGENSIIFKKGDVGSLRLNLERVLEDDLLAEGIARQARVDVEQYTWDRRAERILSFVYKS